MKMNTTSKFSNQLQAWVKFALLVFLWTQAQAGLAQNYCAATATEPWQQWVAQIELNTINNSSGKCDGPCGYSDFTNLSTTLQKGDDYTITMTAGLSWANPNADLYWKVWIDLNQDGDFDDAGENVVSTNGNGPVQTGNINLPASATNGATRMRVALRKAQYAAACGSYVLGEVEDYTVDIQGDGGGGGNGDCASISPDPVLINEYAAGGVFQITVDNPGNVPLNTSVQEIITGNPISWASATVINNTTVELTIQANTANNAVTRAGSVLISCFDGTPNTVYTDFYQTTPPASTCWTDEEAGYGLLASEIQYDPANASVTQTFSNDHPSPYTFGEMIGTNQRSQAMNSVYLGNEVLLDDAFISELSSHVRAFHHNEKDYPQDLAPNQSAPTEIAGQYTGSINKLYKVWKENWANRGLDIEIIASLVNAAPVPASTGSNNFPGKWWSAEQWGATLAERYDNAKIFGKAFAETACPDPLNNPCVVDMLEVGNEAWGYEDPETFKQIYRGIVDGVKSYFVDIVGYADDIEQWPMSIMPGAFQAFRAEGIIGTLNGGPVYDQLGRRLPCDYKDYIEGISVHPYGFVNEERYWMYDIGFGLDQEPEHPRSLFQFLKNAVYWRNVNLPDKEAGNSSRYKTKMYISEFGYGSENFEPYPGAQVFPGVGELTQGIYNLRSILIMGRLGVYRASIYDSWDHNDGAYYGYGLYTDGGGSTGDGPGQPKSHYNTLKNFKDVLGDKRYIRAIHDGDQVNGANLYAYVMGDAAGTPTHLVVWNGTGMGYEITPSGINAQRTALTNNGGDTNVSFSLAALGNITVNGNQATWLHDIPNSSYGGSITVSPSNEISLNVSAIPVMIPLDGGMVNCPSCNDGVQNCDEEGVDCGGSCPNTCPTGDLVFSIVADPDEIATTTIFDATLTLTNNTGQTVNNISIDGSDLNYNNASNNSAAFTLADYNIVPTHGNFNYWTSLWDGFSLADGETASVKLKLKIRVNSECVPDIPMNASGTSSYGNFTGSELVDCGDLTDPCSNGVQDGNEEGVDCGGSCPTTCPPNNALSLTLIADPDMITSTTVFDVTITMVNNTGQSVNNISIDGSNLNYNNASNTAAAFNLANYNITPSHGNFNYWTALWDGFSLANGETATLVIQLQLRTASECQTDIPMSISSTSSYGNNSATEEVDCISGFGGANARHQNSTIQVLQLFPNPVSDQLVVQLNSKSVLDIKLNLLNALGKKMHTKVEAIQEGSNEVLFDTRDLPAGLYYLTIDGYIDQKQSIKFIKVN